MAVGPLLIACGVIAIVVGMWRGYVVAREALGPMIHDDGDPTRRAIGELHRRRGNRSGSARERSLGADAPTGFECPLEEGIQQRAGGSGLLRLQPRRSNLPQDLRLSGDERLETSGDAK